MIDVLIWYVLISLTGWLAFPLAFRLMHGLYDRGVAFLRPLGLLLAGYFFWLLASLQMLRNQPGSLWFSFFILAAVSLWLARGHWAEMIAWLRTHRGEVIATELVFLTAFVAWSIVRAANPEVQYTESSMELAFINSILRSDAFPPRDPWLSGYAISYYYFGYVLVAYLAKLGGTAGAIAFNLGHSLWFAMSATAAYGILQTLLARWFPRTESKVQISLRAWPLIAPLFVLIVSNFEGALALLHQRGLFWSQSPDGTWQSRFWSWLNIQDLNQPPVLPLRWDIHPNGGWPWWRASRVLSDFRFNDSVNPVEVIDEFPFFSYLLGDLHPHVLSMPFVLLAVGIALHVYLSGALDNATSSGRNRWFSVLNEPFFWLASLILGSLAFLNTWDFPFYVALFSAAVVFRRYQARTFGTGRLPWLSQFLVQSVIIGLAGVVLYFPFYLGFSSQAGGILPSLAFFTPGKNYWVMFGPLLLPVAGWLLYRWRTIGTMQGFIKGIRFSFLITSGLWLLSYVFGLILLQLGEIGTNLLRIPSLAGIANKLIEAERALLSVQGITTGQEGSFLLGTFSNRFASPGTWLTIFLLLTLTWGLILVLRGSDVSRAQERYDRQVLGSSPSGQDSKGSGFVLLLIMLGLGLTLFPEFLYLRDLFGVRMNTVFKFYYQAWILLALAAAYASVVLLRSLRASLRLVFTVGWIILMASALVFPIWMLPKKTNSFQPVEWTLDGSAHLRRTQPDVSSANDWLSKAPIGVLAEGVTESYDYGRLRYSVFSGQPSVIGWPFHEVQWGRSAELGSRQDDMRILYTSPDWSETIPILDRYDIRYVIIGPNEIDLYKDTGDGVNYNKFETFLKPVFQNPTVSIYSVPDYINQEGSSSQ